MRIFAISVVLLALSAATACAGGAASKPTLTGVTSGARTVLKGSHFTPRTVVRLLIAGTKSGLAKVRTNDHGAFSYVVSSGVDRCSGFSVQAIGAHGERASYEIQTPDCNDAGVGDTSK